MADGSNPMKPATVPAQPLAEHTLASAPPARPLTREERKEKFKDIRARMRVGQLAVEGDSSVGYYWARKEDVSEISRLEYMGFIITRDDPKNRKVKAAGFKEDGTFVIGDVILMQCEKELYEYFLDENVERGERLISGAREDFVNESAQQGVPTFERGEKAGSQGVQKIFVPVSQ